MVIDYIDLMNKLMTKSYRDRLTKREDKMLDKLQEWYANSLKQTQMNIK